MAKTATRKYKLTPADGSAPRIVEATTQQQALFHAARNQWAIEVLTVDDAIALAAAGVKVEQAVVAGPEQGQLPMDAVDRAVAAFTNPEPAG